MVSFASKFLREEGPVCLHPIFEDRVGCRRIFSRCNDRSCHAKVGIDRLAEAFRIHPRYESFMVGYCRSYKGRCPTSGKIHLSKAAWMVGTVVVRIGLRFASAIVRCQIFDCSSNVTPTSV